MSTETTSSFLTLAQTLAAKKPAAEAKPAAKKTGRQEGCC